MVERGDRALRIDPARCVACANCGAICPMGAISIDVSVNHANVDYDECIECGAN